MTGDTLTECNLELEQKPATVDIANADSKNLNVATANRPDPLFAPDETESLRKRWEQIQSAFVDEPRGSVERADQLVAEAIKRLAEGFAEQRGRMEHDWNKGEEVSTEDLRLALQRYRSFFDRLLSI